MAIWYSWRSFFVPEGKVRITCEAHHVNYPADEYYYINIYSGSQLFGNYEAPATFVIGREDSHEWTNLSEGSYSFYIYTRYPDGITGEGTVEYIY